MLENNELTNNGTFICREHQVILPDIQIIILLVIINEYAFQGSYKQKNIQI